MKTSQLIGASLCLAFAAISTGASAGCLKGAAAGGVAGHFMHHHGLVGAAAGCAVGHYRSTHRTVRADQGTQTVSSHRHLFHRS